MKTWKTCRGFNVRLNPARSDGVPLSYQERRIYHFHEYLDQVIGIDDIPAHLRVDQLLSGLQEDGKGQRIA